MCPTAPCLPAAAAINFSCSSSWFLKPSTEQSYFTVQASIQIPGLNTGFKMATLDSWYMSTIRIKKQRTHLRFHLGRSYNFLLRPVWRETKETRLTECQGSAQLGALLGPVNDDPLSLLQRTKGAEAASWVARIQTGTTFSCCSRKPRLPNRGTNKGAEQSREMGAEQ